MVEANGPNHARGIEMIREMRNHLVRQARKELLAALSGTLGQQANGLMHDIDPEAGSEVLVFRLADEPPQQRLA